MQLINHEFDYTHIVCIHESNDVIKFITLTNNPLIELL